MKNKELIQEWIGFAGMRDITAHRYQTLCMEDVYMKAHDE